MKIRQVGTELFHADGRTDGHTDMTKLIFSLLNFANAIKNRSQWHFSYFSVMNFKLQATYSIQFKRHDQYNQQAANREDS